MPTFLSNLRLMPSLSNLIKASILINRQSHSERERERERETEREREREREQ